MATVRKHRDNWVADYRDQWGKRHREAPEGTYENMAQQKKAAAELLAKRLREVEGGQYRPFADRSTFSEVCDQYVTSKVDIRATTRRSYAGLIELYLRPYFGVQKVHRVTASGIERYRGEMVAGLPQPIAEAFAARLLQARPALGAARAKQRAARVKAGVRTINKSLTLLTMIFNYAKSRHLVEHNPAEGIAKLKTALTDSPIDANILTPTEVALLFDAAETARRGGEGHLTSNNYRLLIRVAVFTGMREGEILGAQWDDIDWNSRQLHVRRAWKEGAFVEPKTASSKRRIDLPAEIVSELRAWRLACPKGEFDLIFPNLEGRPMSHANLLQRGFYPALRRAGLRKIRFHDLRHTFASLLIANGEDVVRVSRLLGHANPTITLNVYSHMLPREHYGSADRLAKLIGHQVGTKTGVDAETAVEARATA